MKLMIFTIIIIQLVFGGLILKLYLNYSFTKFRYIFNLTFSDAKRGILTDEMLSNQYLNNLEDFKRFQDGYEQISNLK